ncbi:MAG: A/G-specific adenine glycosylase [bacterium]|nr:A/G-specific adenine glycosylase [bacterium]
MQNIVIPLLNWYYKNKRLLPWRIGKDPYHVWVSEIMLQQTRIEAVINYYHRFMTELPTISALANCSQDKLLKLWEGLGYYNRVRNLQKAAQIITEQYNGVFPISYQEILALPGIGEYTASAISSICFSLPEPTVDGNVLRVYMRVNNCYDNIDEVKTRKQVRKTLVQIMPIDSGGFNEALMELGETICIPNGIPKCNNCPIKKSCQSYQNNTYLELPVRRNKKSKKEENYTVLLFLFDGMLAISKRKNSGLLRNMWQFPNIETHLTLSQIQSYLKDRGICFSKVEQAISYTHIFTHKKWNMCSYVIWLDNTIGFEGVAWVSFQELKDIYAIPTAFVPFKNYLKEKVDQDVEV